MNVVKIRSLILSKCTIKEYSKDALTPFIDFMNNKDIQEYLTLCLPNNVYSASEVHVLNMEGIQVEAFERSPGFYLFNHGFIPIATTIAGNIICADRDSGGIFFGDNGLYSKDRLYYRDENDRLEMIANFEKRDIYKAAIKLSSNIEPFLNELLCDMLADRIDALN